MAASRAARTIAPILSGNFEVHWPEGMGLLAPDLLDEDLGRARLHAVVRVEQER
jgi:hypothetical protein